MDPLGHRKQQDNVELAERSTSVRGRIHEVKVLKCARSVRVRRLRLLDQPRVDIDADCGSCATVRYRLVGQFARVAA